MTEQLGLFAPRRASAPAGCPRVPGPLCRDGREGRCPGGPRCEELGEQEAKRIRLLEALTPEELATPCGADLGVEEFGTGQSPAPRPPAPQSEQPCPNPGCAGHAEKCAECAPTFPGLNAWLRARGREDLCWPDDDPQPLASRAGLLRERGATDDQVRELYALQEEWSRQRREARAGAPSCGACGSTTGAAFYERGPLAGLRRCWPCARPALTTMEVR